MPHLAVETEETNTVNVIGLDGEDRALAITIAATTTATTMSPRQLCSRAAADPYA